MSLCKQETIITNVDAGKKDLKKIVDVIVKRRPSFEETFEANVKRNPPIINSVITPNFDKEPFDNVNPDVEVVQPFEEIPIVVVVPIEEAVPVIEAVPTVVASSIVPVQTQAVTTSTIPVKEQHLASHELLCPHGSLVKFWKSTTPQDMAYVSPFAIAGAEAKYVTFEPGLISISFSSHTFSCYN